MGKKLKYRTKALAQKAVYYTSPSGCDQLYQIASAKCLSRAMAMLIHKKRSDWMKKRREEGQPPHFGGMRCGKMGGMKKCIKKHIKHGCVKFAATYLRDMHDQILASLAPVKEAVYSSFKDCPEYNEYRKRKLTAKIVAWSVTASYGDKKPAEFYADFARRYIKGATACCSKKCVRCCRKYPKMAMRLLGIADKDVLHVGRRLGALMCCQQCGLKGCSKEATADFAGKWAKEFAPVVTDAVKAGREVMDEYFKDNKDVGDYIKTRKMRRMVLKYLQMTHGGDKKFDREGLKGFIRDIEERKKKFVEHYGKECEGMCRKEETKK